MDPYLEDPDVFPNLHDKFVVYLEELLQPLLPEPYYAKTAQRTWVEYYERDRYPDVSVVIRSSAKSKPKQPAGGVAVATPSERPLMITVEEFPWDEMRETFLEVYTNRGGAKRLVTSVEVLSPTNKTPGEDSLVAYRKKQRETLASNVNLVEIDLLRRGVHATAVPRKELVARYAKFDYHVCVHRFDNPKNFEVHPFELHERLPTIGVPLLPEDGAIRVDLQAVFDKCYDTSGYPREVDYTQPPPPPTLSPERLAWMKSVLAAKSTSGNTK
jgi:hypothetical protein